MSEVPHLLAEDKYIGITEITLLSDLKAKKKTKRYVVWNKNADSVLAEIYWNTGWRQYCFYPEARCIWNTSCLDTVVEFIKKINTEHKNKINMDHKNKIVMDYNKRKNGPQHMIQG